MKNSVRSISLINSIHRIIIALFLVSISFAGDIPTIDKPKNFEAPSKEEGGILTTLVSSYMAVRNSVKFAYDEIMYFEHMYDTYERIHDWFDRNKNKVENTWDASTRIVTDPKDVFTTLRRMETIFDAVDDITLNETKKFDLLLAGGENLWDVATARNNQYTGFIIPNTEQTLDYVEGLFTGKAGMSLSEQQKAQMTADEVDSWTKYYEQRKSLENIPKENWPEERVRLAATLIASSAMANSGALNKWSLKANLDAQGLEKSLNGVEGVNQNGVAGALYALETSNANNKRLRHSIEELKALQGLLGMDMWVFAQNRSKELYYSSQMMDFQMAFKK